MRFFLSCFLRVMLLVSLIISVTPMSYAVSKPIEVNVNEEVVELRTANSKTYVTKSGSYIKEIYNSPIHFESEDGNLHEINTDLVSTDQINIQTYDTRQVMKTNETPNTKQTNINSKKMVSKENVQKFNKLKAIATKKRNEDSSSDKVLTTLEVPFELSIYTDIKKGYSVGKNGYSVTFIPVNTKPIKGIIDATEKNKVVYSNPWPSTELVLTVLPQGVKEDIILYDDKAPKSFIFEVIGDLDDSLANDEYFIEHAWLVDAKGQYRDVETNMYTEKNKKYIKLDWDNSNLTYPITIDPTISMYNPNTFVRCNSSTISIGGFNVGTSPGKVCESYIMFNNLNIPKTAKIASANLQIYGSLFTYQGNLGGYPVEIVASQVTSPLYRDAISPSTTSIGQTKKTFTSTDLGSKGSYANINVKDIVQNSHQTGIIPISLKANTVSNNIESGYFQRTYTQSYPIELDIEYELDDNHRVYTYDSLNRLIRFSSSPSNSDYAYSYDQNGNLIGGSSYSRSNLIVNNSFYIPNLYWNLGDNFNSENLLLFKSEGPLAKTVTTTSYPHKVSTSKNYTFKALLLNELSAGKAKIIIEDYNLYGLASRNEMVLNNEDSNKGVWNTISKTFMTSSSSQSLVIKVEAEIGTVGQVRIHHVQLNEGN